MRAVGSKASTVTLFLAAVACAGTASYALGSSSPIPDGYGPPTAHPGYDSEEGAPAWAHNWGGGGVVMQGYDVVEYRYLKPNETGVQGDPQYSYQLSSAGYTYTFWFKNQTNLETFETDPWQWAPKYGGYCAWGVATEWTSTGFQWTEQIWGPPADVRDGWLVHEGDLYVAIRRDIAEKFLSQMEQLKPVADARWENYWGYREEGEGEGGPFNTRCYPDTFLNAKCNVL